MLYEYREIKTWPYDEKEGCFTKGDVYMRGCTGINKDTLPKGIKAIW
jgi:hypothetical protein